MVANANPQSQRRAAQRTCFRQRDKNENIDKI